MFSAGRLGYLSLLLLTFAGAGARTAAAQTPELSPPMQTPAASAGQAQTPAQTPATPKTDITLPIDLMKVKQGAMQPPTSLIDRDAMRIHVTTIAPFPKFTDIAGDFNLFGEAVPGSGMTHAQFLAMTRPKDMYSAAGFTVSDVVKFAMLGYAERKAFELLRKGALALRDAKTEAERKEIQARIEMELKALKGSGEIK